MNFDDVSYVGVPEDDDCIINAVQIGKIIDEPPHTIRSWADEFEEFLYIKKINGRFSYTQKSVEQFELIKKLRREKNYSIKQIKEQLKIKGFNYDNHENEIINTNDITLLETIKVELGIEMKSQLNTFLIEFLKAQRNENDKLIESVKTEVEQTVQEQLEDSMAGIKQELEMQRQENKKLSERLSSIQQEVAITQELNSKMDNIKLSMEQRKKESEEQSQQQTGFFGKLFGKKK
jgi:DNA-binding transcriptional MerR regulator